MELNFNDDLILGNGNFLDDKENLNENSYDSEKDLVLVKEEMQDVKAGIEEKINLGLRTPLLKNEYISIKISCNDLNLFYSPENKNFKYEIQLNPYCKVTMGDKVYITKDIFHNSPFWSAPINFDLDSEDKNILIEVFTKGVYENKNNNGFRNKPLFSGDTFVGFQLLPINFIEKVESGLKSITMKLIREKPMDYFNDKDDCITTKDNHNPMSYLLKSSNDLSPSITIEYLHMNERALMMINCNVDSVMERDDEAEGTGYIYKLFIKRMDSFEFFKECSFEEIASFKKAIEGYSKDIKEISFEDNFLKILSHIPIMGSCYEIDIDTNRELKERVSLIDRFLEMITKNFFLYTVEEFIHFFSENLV